MPAPKKRPTPSKKKAPSSKRSAKRSSGSRRARAPRSSGGADQEDSFPSALAKLLRTRKIAVPKGLLEAPPEAYASQPASIVEQFDGLKDADLKKQAEKVATFAERQRARAKAAWDGSPLIAELRRRKLKEPRCPTRVVGASVSLTKPLSKWTDRELLRAASEWSEHGS